MNTAMLKKEHFAGRFEIAVGMFRLSEMMDVECAVFVTKEGIFLLLGERPLKFLC